jgi:hypothetical protein
MVWYAQTGTALSTSTSSRGLRSLNLEEVPLREPPPQVPERPATLSDLAGIT